MSQEDNLKHIVEGAILAAGEPITIDRILQCFEEPYQPKAAQVKAAIAELQTEYDDRSFELKQVGSGYRFQVKTDYAPWIKNLWQERAPRGRGSIQGNGQSSAASSGTGPAADGATLDQRGAVNGQYNPRGNRLRHTSAGERQGTVAGGGER